MKPIRLPGMDLAANFLNSRSVREKQLIVGFVIALALFVDFTLLVQPVARALFDLAPKVPPLRQELRELTEDVKSRDAIQKKWDEAKQRLQDKEQLFIAADGAPALLENLSKDAQRAGVKITSVEPQESDQGAKHVYGRLPVAIKATAGTNELGRFLSTLETGKTFFCVKDLQIGSNPQNERKHLIQLSLETYKKER